MASYNVKLEQFTGPLDLLLYLIRTQRMDIFDLDIARITEDYLGIIESEGVRDLEGAYHFLSMASALVELKSRMLLPQQPKEIGEDGELEDSDPRIELVRQLQAYESIQGITEELAQRYEDAGRHWPRQTTEKLEEEIVYTMDSLSVYDLMTAFSEVLARPRFKQATIFQEDYDLDDAREWLRDKLRGARPVLADILLEQKDAHGVVVTFIALLEMIKQEEVDFEREEGRIIIYRRSATDVL